MSCMLEKTDSVLPIFIFFNLALVEKILDISYAKLEINVRMFVNV